MHESLADRPGFRTRRVDETAEWLANEEAPLRPQQVSKQADLEVVADFGDDVADVTHDADGNRRLQRQSENDDDEDDHRIERKTDHFHAPANRGGNPALAGMHFEGGAGQQRNDHRQTEQLENAGHKQAADDDDALADRSQAQRLSDGLPPGRLTLLPVLPFGSIGHAPQKIIWLVDRQ